MVVRDDLIEDLVLLIQATQWPNDKTNSTLARNGANRVPKPPRTPLTTPTSLHVPVTHTDPLPRTDASRYTPEDVKNEEENKRKKSSCFGLEAFIPHIEPSSFFVEPDFNIELQSQYDQLSPSLAGALTYHGKYTSSKSISSQGGSRYLPSSRYQSATKLGTTAISSVGDSGFTCDISTSQTASSTLLEPGSPVDQPSSPPLLKRQLSTKTQEVVLLLLAEVFELNDEQLQHFVTAAYRRKSADVKLELTLETIGRDNAVHGSLRLLGGKDGNDRDLRPPLPTNYTTQMPVDNLWSQQLLVRFSRDRTVMVENNTKAHKKLKIKKPKKNKESEDSSEYSTLHKNQTGSALGSPSKPPPGPDFASSETCSSFLPDRADTSTPEPRVLATSETSLSKTPRTGKGTLQRGLKGLRQSLKKKKKRPKSILTNDGDKSRDDQTAVTSLDGIAIGDVSTLKKDADVEVMLVEKSSKSPFQRFGSLRGGKGNSPFNRLNKLRRSLGKAGSSHKVNAGHQTLMIEDKPFIISKEELVTTSAKPLNRSYLNPFGDLKGNSDDELDSTNPFITSKDSGSEQDATNPFQDESAEHSSSLPGDPLSFNNKSRSKGIRKSIRKTFNRLGNMGIGKKADKGSKSYEEIPLKGPHHQGKLEVKEELKNRVNIGEISPVKLKTVIESLPSRSEPSNVHPEPRSEPLKVEQKVDSPAKFEVITEELAYKLIALQDAASNTNLEETLPLVDGLRVVLTLKLAITFQTKCQPFDIYKTAYQALYRKRFREMVPMKLPLEGVDCNATVDGEILLKQVSIFCPMSPLRVALARFLVLTEAATGKMGTPNTISVRSPQKKSSVAPVVTSATHVVEVHQMATSTSTLKDNSGGSSPVGFEKVTKGSPSKSPVKDRLSTTPPNGKSGSGSSTPTDKSRLSTCSTEEPADEIVYNQKSETILINPSDLLVQWERVSQGLTQGVYTRSETTEALVSGVALVRWMVGHHLERLQTVFPVSGNAVTSKNLADTLRYLHLAESCEPLREYFEAETAEIGLGGVRDHVLGAVRKYTQLWVAALIRETTQRIDNAMKEQETTQPRTVRPSSQGSGEAKSRAVSLDKLLDEAGKLPFSASGVAEAMPALVSSLVRTVRQFENNKQIVYFAEMVEKRLGTYRPTGPGALSNVAMPMIGYQREGSLEPADEDEVAEIVLRLDVVGRLMPVIVDFLEVAKNFYDPIFRKCFQLPFLEECWQVLVDGALALWRQIGASGSLRVCLVEPPLKPEMMPQAISAVWSLCYSFSKINKLSETRRTDKTQYSNCMDDCVMCWLQLIGQSSKLQLQRDIKTMAGAGETQTDHLMEITNGTRVLIKLVVDKTEELVWPGPNRPAEVLTFLGYQLTVLLDTFWRMLYLDHKDPSKRPNVISYWSCRIMDSLCDLRDQVADALERLDPSGEAVAQALSSLQLLPQKAAQLMCMQELTHVEEWVSRAASGGGGGALVRLLDGALQELYDCLAPAQPLVACLRDRLLDATAKHLDDVTQEEEFNQLAAVLVALRQFFTSNILLEEALQAAESRWEQQMADAQERGRPLAELQQSYYSLRLQEQHLQQLEDQNANNSLLINVVFIENYGLSVSIVQAPSAVSIVKAASASYAATTNNNTLHEAAPILPPVGGASRVAPKTTGMFSNMFKGASGVGGVYVKAQLVPAEWFPGATHDYKTSLCKDDPAVIDEEINFPHVNKTSGGVERGGFLLLRLKLTRRLRSQTVGETLVPLESVEQVALQARRTVRHTHLAVSKAAPLHTYEPLNILRRRNDETACQFLSQLEQDNKGQQKAALRGSNTSLSNMW